MTDSAHAAVWWAHIQDLVIASYLQGAFDVQAVHPEFYRLG